MIAAALAALVLAPSSLAQARLLMPGISYERDVDFTPQNKPAEAVLARGFGSAGADRKSVV